MFRSASHPTKSNAAILFIAGLLLFAFLLATVDLRRESLWNDEAWTAWAIRSPYVRDLLQRVEGDVHPPLYFLLLGGLDRFAGDSVLALRWPSALFSLIGLAATYALGKRLFDRRTGIIALILLGTASFFVYYAREARMYSLLMALAVLATLLYVRWRAKPSLWRAFAYSLAMTALLYTQYAGIFIIASHLLHAIVTQFFSRTQLRAKWYRLPLPYIVAAILFLPWLPTFIKQMHSNPNGPLAIPVPTNWATVAALILILTGGNWGLMVVPFVLGTAIPKMRQYSSTILLLIVWLLVTPISLLALNMWFAPIYQVRYTIGMLPAGALLVAYGLRHIGLPQGLPTGKIPIRLIASGVTIVLVAWLTYVQLTMFSELWPPKPAWETTIRSMISPRKLLDATISDMAAYSPAAYYDRQLGVRRGVGLDLSWRLQTPEEVHKLVSKLDSEPSVWIVLPVNTAKSWQVAAQLDQNRSIGYRSGLGNMVFYRFDRGGSTDLQFEFGQRLHYNGKLLADQELSTQAGQQLCVNITLETLEDVDNSFSVGLHLVDITGNVNAAQWDNGFGPHKAHETVALAPCLNIPQSVPTGPYHLELTIYNWSTLERLPVLETSIRTPVAWGDVLMMQAVDVKP
ncbi:MAG: glycosyltransferase family 39 protein [Anaerolineae bacterium]|nr:glycosyltransferase family 39 protein [Anaerolineae bacterium]